MISNLIFSDGGLIESNISTATGVKNSSGGSVTTSDAQYMQQQSQIFVFTTLLANQAAEAVQSGSYPSIIAYHCAQDGTKKLLEVILKFEIIIILLLITLL